MRTGNGWNYVMGVSNGQYLTYKFCHYSTSVSGKPFCVSPHTCLDVLEVGSWFFQNKSSNLLYDTSLAS